MAKSKEVAIIGAGVIGCSIGYHLARVNGDIILATGEIQSVEHYFSSKARPDFDDRLSEEVKIKI